MQSSHLLFCVCVWGGVLITVFAIHYTTFLLWPVLLKPYKMIYNCQNNVKKQMVCLYIPKMCCVEEMSTEVELGLGCTFMLYQFRPADGVVS